MFKDSLVSFILGGANDGKIVSAPKSSKFHIDAFRDIYSDLIKLGYDVPKYNTSSDGEACFDLLRKGYVTIKTIKIDDVLMYFVYIPDNISIKQLEALKDNVDQFKGSDVFFCRLINNVISYELVKDVTKVLVK